MRRVRLAIAALLSGFPLSLAAQPAAAPTPAADAARYRFDLERNFFPTPAAEVAGRVEVERGSTALTALARSIEAPGDLLVALEADDRLQRLFRRHDLYLFLRYATDIRREADMQASDAMRGQVRAARQALRRAIIARDDAWLRTASAVEPRLGRYAFFIDTVRRDAGHLLSAEQQEVVSALEPFLGARDYPRLANGLRFGNVTVGDRTLNGGQDEAEIQANPSPAIRREGFRALLAGYAERRDQFAAMLIRVVESGDALARLRGHESARTQAMWEAWVTPAGYEALLAEVARHGALYKDWQRRSDAPLSSIQRWTPAQAASAIVASSAALGPDYQREFAALLDPVNGRADLGAGEHRLPATGTASVYPIGTSAIYMRGYTGTLLDLIVLAHEGGHAVQAQLMFRAGVPFAYAAGPGYFTESFGRFQELLLLDHLYRAAREPGARGRARDALAARLLAVFASAEEAAVELAIHQRVGASRARTADDLDAATAEAGGPYSVEYERAPERRGLWMLSEGYFMAPMQELNDAYASLLAVRYFQLHRRDPRRFRTNYLALLSGGYDGAPVDLLRRHLGIDMASPGFVADTMAGLRAEIDSLYR